MGAYQCAAAFKRISEVIDREIKIKNNENLPELVIKNSDITFKSVDFKYETEDVLVVAEKLYSFVQKK